MDDLNRQATRAEKEEILGLITDLSRRLREEQGIDLTDSKTVKMPTVWVYRVGLGVAVLFWALFTAWFTITYITRESANATFARRDEVALLGTAMNTLAKTQQDLVTQVAVINSNTARVGSLETRIQQLERDIRNKP